MKSLLKQFALICAVALSAITFSACHHDDTPPPPPPAPMPAPAPVDHPGS